MKMGYFEIAQEVFLDFLGLDPQTNLIHDIRVNGDELRVYLVSDQMPERVPGEHPRHVNLLVTIENGKRVATFHY